MGKHGFGGAVALVAFVWAGWAQASEPAAWRTCWARTAPLDGVVYMLQSVPFDSSPEATFEARMLAQRPFEAPLKALGASRVWDADVQCTPAVARKQDAKPSEQAAYNKGLLETVGVRVIDKPWVPALAREEQGAVLLMGLGELASPATRASRPENWGVTRDDFARMHNEALMKKARVDERRASLEKAAAAGDAYAQHLLAIRPDGQEDDLVMMKRAADQGLLRARVDYLTQAPWPTDPKEAAARVLELERLVRLRSPHASFYAGMSLLQPSVAKGDQRVGFEAVMWSQGQGYAPAQLTVAEQLVDSEKEAQRREAMDLARGAAAQGLRAASEFLAKHPAP
jgi:hypothetical protein